MDKNVKDLYKLVELADELNVNSVNFQPLLKDNTNFINQGLPEFWLKDSDIPILQEEILKINNFRPRHTTVYKEPRLELLVKYYGGKLTKRDWICFGGFRTVFICYSKGEPLVYTCHGTCGNLDKVPLKRTWTSRDAYKLRLHSKGCRNLCMQSCYSKESAQSFINLVNHYIKRAG
jgi:MoaA/NifB/PqqE/SkfB family radical SAM enzyme